MRIRWSCDGTVVPGTNASQHNYEKGFWHPQVLNEAITLMHLYCVIRTLLVLQLESLHSIS